MSHTTQIYKTFPSTKSGYFVRVVFIYDDNNIEAYFDILGPGHKPVPKEIKNLEIDSLLAEIRSFGHYLIMESGLEQAPRETETRRRFDRNEASAILNYKFRSAPLEEGESPILMPMHVFYFTQRFKLTMCLQTPLPASTVIKDPDGKLSISARKTPITLDEATMRFQQALVGLLDPDTGVWPAFLETIREYVMHRFFDKTKEIEPVAKDIDQLVEDLACYCELPPEEACLRENARALVKGLLAECNLSNSSKTASPA